MPAPIHSLLADRLDLTEQQAEQLLEALLQEVQKRARNEGVRLPDLGTFRSEDGQLTFEPSPSLSRAVNEEFEGMDPETLPSQPEEDEHEDDSGPNTITLGYQSSDWSPSDAPEENTDNSSSEEAQEEPADTDEYDVPTEDDDADTEEIDVPSSVQNQSDESTSSEPDAISDPDSESPSDREQDPAPSPPRPPEPEQTEQKKEEREQLSSIWDPEEETEIPDAEDPVAEEKSRSFDFPDPPSASPDDEPERDTSESPTSEEPDRSASPPPSSTPPTSSSEGSSSSLPRILVTTLFVLLLIGGGWFVLGRMGTVPPPTAVLSPTVQALQSDASSPSAPSTSSSSSEPTTSDDATATTEDPSSSESTRQGPPSTPSQQEESSPTPGIDATAGGWTIVVASRTSRSPAEELRTTYRNRFSNTSLPVDILVGEADGTTRYRVAVGQYRSREEARQALRSHQSNLPEGAWPLRLE